MVTFAIASNKHSGSLFRLLEIGSVLGLLFTLSRIFLYTFKLHYLNDMIFALTY